MLKATVIGGSGFIGTHVVEALLQHGCHVQVVSRQPLALAPSGGKVDFLRGAVGDRARMHEVIAGSDYVFHLATGGGTQWSDFQRDFIDGTRNVAEACLSHGVARLIYMSSIAALDLGQRGTITEASGVDSQPSTRGPYSRAKVEAEKVLLQMHSARRLPVVILRPGIVVGGGGAATHSGVGQWPSDACCIGWGSGKNELPFVLVEDVAQACVLAMRADGINGEVFNLAGDVRLSAREYVGLFAERSLRNIRYYPQSLLKLQSIEIGKWLLKCVARKADNPFPSFRDLRSRSMRSRLDCSAAKTKLGWRPNQDLEGFVREAIVRQARPIEPGDLRLREPLQAC